MKLKLDFPIAEQPVLEGFGQVCLLGSCFAEHQKGAFLQSGFSVMGNPFGILYNPHSIATILKRMVSGNRYSIQDFEAVGSLFFSYEHHSKCSYDNLEQAIESSNQLLQDSVSFIKKAKLVVVTLGTSIVHKLAKDQVTVGNCHKQPNALFYQEQMSVEEIVSNIESIKTSIHGINPECQIILSISPVRHIRSGLLQNNLSKSSLRVAIAQSSLSEFYFPAFEIFIDELRDHRFAGSDLIHPNTQALEYIWDRFTETYFSKKLQAQVKEILDFRKFQAHKPRKNPEEHAKTVKDKEHLLKNKYPEARI